MNFSSFPPLMHSPHLMSAHPLQPSPFSPDQFLTTTRLSTHPSPSDIHLDSSAELSDEDASSAHTFIKKRPIEITEDLVEGRVETFSQRLRRRRSRATSGDRSAPPELHFTGVEPMTPPNRPPSPMPFLSHDMRLSGAADRSSHSPQSRRTPKNRRSPKVKRSCNPSNRKSPRESSPALMRSRSPLGRWPPPAVSAFQLFSLQPRGVPTTPPPCPTSYSFNAQPPVWTNNYPWTIASPSSSPYPSHSPPPRSEYQA